MLVADFNEKDNIKNTKTHKYAPDTSISVQGSDTGR